MGDLPAESAPARDETVDTRVMEERLAPSLHHRDQADAAIEGAQHFRRRNAARLRQPAEHRLRRPAFQINFGIQAIGQGAGQILGDAAAGDMGEPFDAARMDRF